MGGRARKSIYGVCKATCKEGDCTPSFSPLEQLTSFIDVLDTFDVLISKYFTPQTVVFPLHANMSVAAQTNASVGARIVWRYEHPEEVFDRNDPVHLLQLKIIFQNNYWNWEKDPLFKQSA